MYVPEKKYTPNASDLNDLEEQRIHEEEMNKAFERMEKRERRKKKTLLCGVSGFIVGVLYIIYVSLGIEWVDMLITRIAGEGGVLRFVFDFLPPVIISGLIAWFIARKEKGSIIYILTSISVFFVVLLVFLVYVSLMMM